MVEFLWKLSLRKMKIISANADQNFDNFSQTLGPFNKHFWANRPKKSYEIRPFHLRETDQVPAKISNTITKVDENPQ